MTVDIFVLLLILEKHFQLFTIDYDAAVDLLYMATIVLRYVPSIPSLLSTVYLFIFTMKGCCIW